MKAAFVKLSAEDLLKVREVAEKADAGNGERYPPDMAALLFADTAELK